MNDKKIRLLRRGETLESICTNNASSTSGTSSVSGTSSTSSTSGTSGTSSILETILSRKNMEIQKQFGKKVSVYALKNNNAKNDFLNFLKQKYDIVMSSGNKYFKFLESEDITTSLKTIDHVVFFNTNPKYVLLMRTKIKNVNVYIYVFKSTSEVYIVNYKGTVNEGDFILEGEIVNDTNYLISDLLVYNNLKNNYDITIKKSKIEKIIETIDTSNGPSLKIKEYVSMCNSVSFVRDMLPKIEYKELVNGLVFRPVSGSRNKNIILILNKPFHNLKLVRPSLSAPAVIQKNKISFKESIKEVVCYGMKTSRGPDVIDLYFTNKRDELIKHGIAYVPTLKHSIEVQKIFENKNQALVCCDVILEQNKLVISSETQETKASLIENISV
jgi:hypothetical protein